MFVMNNNRNYLSGNMKYKDIKVNFFIKLKHFIYKNGSGISNQQSS